MRKFGWLLGCLLAMGLCGSANAADDSDLNQGWNLRAGFFIPERESARAAEGDVWLSVGAERPIYEAGRYQYTVSVDYYGSGSLYNVPIMINLRAATNYLRYGAGAGVGISHNLTDGIVGFAYNLMVGYELIHGEKPVVADLRYMGLSTGSGVLNGWSFALGFRF